MRKRFTMIIALAGLAAVPQLSQAQGQELYMKYCKKCHGVTGAGDTAMGKRFEIADYTKAETQAGLTDEQIATAIRDGITNDAGKKVMLAFGKKLSEDEIGEIVAYFRSLQAD